jgi:hypothetical protein
LTLNNVMTEALNYDVYFEAVTNLMNDKLSELKAKVYTQVRKRAVGPLKLKTRYVRKHYSVFSANLLSRRVILKELKDKYSTRPYGWSVT